MDAQEGAAGPQDVVVVGDEDAVAAQLGRLRDTGATEFFAAPFGSAEQRRRTARVLAGIAVPAEHRRQRCR